MLLARVGGLDLIHDIGAVDTPSLQPHTRFGEFPKQRPAPLVDRGDVAQVKPHRFPF